MYHVVFLLLCFAPVAWSYGNGLVMPSCNDMVPQHGVAAQISSAPFSVTLDRNTYNVGDQVKVQLQATSSTPFIGFLLKAVEVGGTAAVGSFTVSTTNAQRITCSSKSNTAVSHTSKSSKTLIQATWTPEASGSGKSIQFLATFVQTERIFWVAVQSPTMTFNGSSGTTSTTGSVSSTTTTQASSTSTPLISNGISGADCGVTKTCVRNPSNCDPSVSSTCYFMSAMPLSSSDGAIRYEITGPLNGYVAFGFSDDQDMGNDDIYICGKGSNGLPMLQHAYSTGKTAPQILSLGSISNQTVTVQNNVISCSFISTNTISTQRAASPNQTYYVLVAYGPSSSGQIQVHSNTFTSSNKIDLTKVQALTTDSGTPPIVRAHGCLMLISWMTTGTLGMITARYLKGMARGHKLCGKDLWFMIHVPVMFVTVSATIIAFIIIFVYAQDWAGGAHPILGCLVMILSFIQPIVALMRCGPQHTMRYLFNWTHSLNALVIKILAVAAIFTGLDLLDGSETKWMVKVMSGFAAWECLFYVFLECHFRWKIHSTESLGSNMTNIDSLLTGLYFVGNIAFLVALLVGIGTATVIP